ncbi:MAG: hypothetical protein LUG52_10495, partial [Clostridia bacterium]|nr:hypothetical protein [Clostridia bacterium]
MAERKTAWDKYEAVVLLDGLLEVLRGETPRPSVVSRVSCDLRQMAVNRGINIDEAYRSESGISFQMEKMRSAYLGYTVSIAATKLFTQTVKTYNENRNEYEKLLKEAKVMIEGSKPKGGGFAQYLAGKVSPAQYNALYRCYPEIEEFCLKLKILKKPLFETTDFEVIKKVQRTIEENKVFKMGHKQQYKLIVAAGRHYYTYIKNGLFLQKEIAEPIENNDADAATITQSPKKNDDERRSEERKNRPAKPKADICTNAQSDEILLQKYPVIYKRVFSALQTLSEENENGVTVEAINSRIDNIARVDVIEEILNNASWACVRGGKYTFSESDVKKNKKSAPKKDQNRQISIDDILYTLDLNEKTNLAYTKPMSFSYFGEEKPCGTSWAELYVNFVATMCEDYPHVFIGEMNFSEGNGRVDLAEKSKAGVMVAPKAVPGTGFVLETNLSADHAVGKIRRILDICNVDYDNVVIAYKKKITLRKSEKGKSSSGLMTETKSYSHGESEAEVNTGITTVLKQYYAYGFKYDSIREIMRFRQFADLMGIDLPEDDEALKSSILSSGTTIDGKVYCKSEDMPQELRCIVDKIFSSGTNVIYYECLYENEQEWMNTHVITSPDMLKKYLQDNIEGCFFAKMFMVKGIKRSEREAVSDELRRVWGANPVEKVSALCERLPYVPQENIWRVISGNNLFSLASEGEYLLIERFHIKENEKEDILKYVKEACDEGGFSSLSSVPLGDIEEENYELTQATIYNAIYKKVLVNEYHLNGKILTKDKSELDTVTLLKEYIKDKDECTFSEISEKVVELTGGINRQYVFRALYDDMVRVDKDRFVANRFVEFPLDEIDAVLGNFFTDDFIAIREVSTFAMFPLCGQNWNHFLLESFCYKYSRKYNL